MNFLKVDGDNLVFHLGKREKRLLLDLLKLYPLIPPAHHRLSGSVESPAMEANQKLLEEALTEHRSERKKEVEAMLNEPHRFQEIPSGFELVITAAQVEWLLQILNDIRIGSWLQLGSPDEKRGKEMRLNLQNARYLWSMELCGHFEHALLSGQAAEEL